MLAPRGVIQYGILALLALGLVGVSLVSAQTVTVSGVVEEDVVEEDPDTIVQFSGLAFPSGVVTLREDGTVINTQTAAANATFSMSNVITPGTHTYTLVGTDGGGRTSSTLSYTLTLSTGSTTAISNIFLSPTFTLTAASITADDAVTSSGATVPNSSVTVYVASTLDNGTTQNRQYTTAANSQGQWSFALLGNELGIGSHSIRSRSVVNGTQQSALSSIAVVDVEAAPITEPPDPCDSSTPGDINCDGAVDLIDFSILLFYWQVSNPDNERADINSDTIVNITDFSILLFYWTG